MHANELTIAADWFGRALFLAAAVFSWHRARRHAREAKHAAGEARKAERLAWLHTANTLVAEERLTAMLPPDVVPFQPYRDDKEHVAPGVPCGGFPEGRPAEVPPATDQPREPAAPATLPFKQHFKPRLAKLPRGEGA